MKNFSQLAIVTLATGGLVLALAPAARADIPAGYTGMPFDPAVVGGAGIIPTTVKKGPYQLPGRLDFVNYDMGGDGTAYHTDAHYTTKGGDGYRTDRPTATMCLTATSKPDIYYDTGNAAMDGMPYPAAGVADFYVGSVHPNDWFNYTVDVQTAGMYTLDAFFSTGNGPPGGEGGNGDMELIIFVNGTKQADWKTVLPDEANKANYHNWKPYPGFAKLTLDKGLNVVKFQAPFQHLNLDYVDFKLDGAGGGGSGGAGGTGGTAAGGSAGSGGTLGTSGASGSTSSAGADTGGSGGTPVTTGESGTGTTTGGGGSGSGSSSIAGSTSTAGTTAAAGTAPVVGSADAGDTSGCGCSLGKQHSSRALFGLGALFGLSLLMNARRRSARR